MIDGVSQHSIAGASPPSTQRRNGSPQSVSGDIPGSLVELDRTLVSPLHEVVLGGGNLSAREILHVARCDTPVRFTDDPAVLDRIAACHARMMRDVAEGVPVYGCNTGYGAQASKVLAEGSSAARYWFARAVSEGISAIDIGVGPPLDRDVIRAAILLRINMLMGGVSAVKLDDLDLLRRLLNLQITPYVQQFGGLGASGDLSHNARVVSVLRQLEGSRVWDREGHLRDARETLVEAGFLPLELDPKAGLGLCNGDNFSTAFALLVAADTLRILLAAIAVSALTVEALRGTDRNFHPLLDAVRPHPGQREAAALFRHLLSGSGLAYQEMSGHLRRPPGESVQDGYSVRGVAQYLSVSIERIKAVFESLTINANSVSDNPLWVPPDQTTPGEEPWQWVSGANFLAMHAAEALDGLRKTLTQVVKLADRHLARLVNPHLNAGLPANLSEVTAFTGCMFKGMQIQSGMFEVYSTYLSFPVTTLFGVHEEGNQDVTTHALTSGILALENVRLARYALAQNLLALAQAVDYRGGGDRLSPRTRPIYEFVRGLAACHASEGPLHRDIERLYQAQVSGAFAEVLRDRVFSAFGE
jgi:phenylalanine ammonia-lyase